MTPTDTGPLLAHLDLLARAISGTTLVLTTTEQRRAFVDGASIALPAGSADAIAAVSVQAALLAIGSLTPPQVRELSRCDTETVERYVMLEAARAATTPFLLPPRVARQIRALRVEPAGTDAGESLRAARERGDLPVAPEWLGTIKPRLLRRRAAPLPGDGGEEAAELTLKPAGQVAQDDEDSESERSRILELLSAPLGSQALTRALGKLLGLGSKTGDGAGQEGGGAADRVRPASRGRGRPTADLQPPTIVRSGIVVAGARYPEWNADAGAFREGWCTVYGLDPRVRPDAPGLTAPVDTALRRELSRLGTAHERRRRLRDGDVVNTCDAVEHEVSRRLGRFEDPRVFETRTRTARDLAVLVLLDATDSTAAPGTSAAGGRSLFDEQRLLAHRLTVALEELGDRVGTYAFNSFGRNHVRFLRVKDFDGRYDEAARARLASVRPHDYTRLGAAIRHASHLLGRDAGTSHQLLVVVGDGYPYDEGYENRYAREDSRVALQEALEAGIGCVSISVAPATHSAETVWSEVVHVALKDQSELDRRAREAFGTALRLAVARRRAPGTTTAGQTRKPARSA